MPRRRDALPRSFFARDARTVARALLGAQLVHHLADGRVLRARIVETEAYVGTHDLACHASRGRTARTAVMFGPAGVAYIYLVYGIHELFNVVTGEVGSGEAVLVRAAEAQGELTARLDGPGRLSRAMGIGRALCGSDVCNGPLHFVRGTPPRRIASGPRIGVDYAGVWARAPLRFYDADSACVSRRRKVS